MSDTTGSGGLSASTRDRIWRNKERALAILKGSPHVIDATSDPVATSVEACAQELDDGSPCKGLPDRLLRENFDEYICFHCKEKSLDYGLVTKTTAKQEYLLGDSCFKSLKHISKPNPMNPRWTGIKLFLRKHCIKAALTKWGSMENLMSELRNRETEKYEKSVARTRDLFNQTSPELLEARTSKDSTAKSKSSRKRKASDLIEMASIIRGK